MEPMMDELDIRMLAESDIVEAIELAKLHGFDKLVLELGRVKRATPYPYRPEDNPFYHLQHAGISVSKACDVCFLPRSTGQAAGQGRIAGNMTDNQRKLLLDWLRGSYTHIARAIELCEAKA